MMEVENFEKYLDQKDAKIKELEIQNVNLKAKLKAINFDHVDL